MSYNKDCRAGYLQYLNFNSEDAQMPRFCDMPHNLFLVKGPSPIYPVGINLISSPVL